MNSNIKFKETDYFLFNKNENQQLDEIKNILIKRRFSFAVPIKYYNALKNSDEYNILFVTCGIQNPNNDQKSIRLFLKDDSIFGSSMVQLMKESKSFNKTLHCINQTFLNIKTYELLSSFNDENNYSTFDELCNAYDLEFKKELTDACDAYKINNKMIIMLNECIDLTNNLNETNKFIKILQNNLRDEDDLNRYFNESVYEGLVYHNKLFDHKSYEFIVSQVTNNERDDTNSYIYHPNLKFSLDLPILTNYENLRQLYENQVKRGCNVIFRNYEVYKHHYQHKVKLISGENGNGKASVMMQLFNFTLINF